VRHDFRQRLKTGEVLIGAFITLYSPEICEILAEIGFDWLCIDTEQGAFDSTEAQRMLQAVGNRCPCVIRVPSHEDFWIKKALDIGAAGIIVPLVNTPEMATRITQASKYAPEGNRGVGLGRAHLYGLKFQEYVDHANSRMAVILQAEHIDAANNIESIVKIPGIDGILVGPYDLSASMGKIGKVSDPEVKAAIRKIQTAALKAGLRLGIFGFNAEAVKPYLKKGYTLIAVGTDALLLIKAGKDALTLFKGKGKYNSKPRAQKTE
jgi:2-dehydro-3-deoxyglucarate aldolase